MLHETVNEYKFRRIVLDIFKRKFTAEISRNQIDRAYIVDDMAEEFINNIRFQVDMSIAGEKLEPVYITYPRNWKEAVKERWLPEWMKKKFPPKYITYKIGANVFYPGISLPENKNNMVIYKKELKGGN